MNNKVQLICYAQRLGSGTLKSLNALLQTELAGLFGTVHILPFFTPIDGADMGFDPTNHQEVDSSLGTWQDIKAISTHCDVMADCIVNHISADSTMFKDYIAKGMDSQYAGLFLSFDSVFPNGATEQALANIYRPRPGLSFSLYQVGKQNKLMWTTFTNKQIDIDVYSDEGKSYLEEVLHTFAESGISTIRMDAVGYAVKTAGTTCFMNEQTFEFIAEFAKKAQSLGIETLVEVHAYFALQREIAKKVDWVYDFALPPLILHTLHSKNCKALARWLSISPRNCISVLDTHDGIGIIDVGHRGKESGLLNAEEIDHLVESIHNACKGKSRLATGAVASNLDLYQINCTFYEALACNDTWYLWARALQFFAPGVPQVYYVGLFAGTNEMDLLAESNVGRDINRGVYDNARIAESMQKPVVKTLFALIRFRNSHRAFNGEFMLNENKAQVSGNEDISQCIQLSWRADTAYAKLLLDTAAQKLELSWSSDAGEIVLESIEEISKYFP